MATRFRDFDGTLDVLDELRHQMERVWDDLDDRTGAVRSAQLRPAAGLFATGWPRLNLNDDGAAFVITADVPGLTAKDVAVTLHDGVLTLTGERHAKVPEGYTAHRQERAGLKFTRSLSLPTRVDPEKTTADVKDGVLTVTLAKAAEVRPRQITVKTS